MGQPSAGKTLLIFLATRPWRLFGVMLQGAFVFFKNVAWNIGPMLLFYFFVLLFLALSFGTYPIQANQAPVLKFLVDVTKVAQDGWNLVAGLIQQILDCKEILVDLWNTIMHLIASVVKRVFNAVNTVLNLGLPPLFGWAERGYLLERELERHEKQNILRQVTEEFMGRANATLAQVDPRYHHIYLDKVQRHILRTAARRAGVSARITILPSEFCDLVLGVFDFFIGLLSIFSDYFLFFLDLILGAYDAINGDFTESFLFLFVRSLLLEIFKEIPLTECLIDTDVIGDSAGSIPQSALNDVPRRIIACLCPWRYKNPLNFPSFLTPGNVGDVVPSNPGVAIFGCICPNPSVSLTSTTNIQTLFFRCLGLDLLVNQFNEFKRQFDILKERFEEVFEDLGELLTDILDLRGLYDALKSAYDFLEGLLPRRRSEGGAGPVLPSTEQLDRRLADRLRMFEAMDLQREMMKQLTNQTYVDEMGERRGMQAMQSMMTLAVEASRNGKRIAEKFQASGDTIFQRVLARLPERDAFRQFYERMQQRGGAQRAEHVQAFRRGLESLLDVAKGHIGARGSRDELETRLDSVDMVSFVRAVYALSGRDERMRAPPGLRALDAAGSMLIGTMFGPDQMRRAARRVHERYGSDPAARDGVRFAARYVQHPEGLRGVMRQFNLTEADVARVHREVRQETREMKAENAARLSYLGDIRNYAASEFVQYVDGVHYAYYDYSAAHMTGRVIVVGVFLVGGAATAAVSVAGFALGVGLAAGATILVGVLAPLIIFATLFFQYTLTLVSHIAAGILVNALPALPDSPYMFDIITPYIEAAKGPVTRSFFFGFTLDDAVELALSFGEITAKHAEYIGAWTLAYATGKWPLPLGRYIKTRDPLINENGEMDESFPEFIIDGILYCPQDTPCLDDGDCGGADCVCPGTPSRLGTERPANPCTGGMGKCRCWPFIQERVNVQTLQVDLNLDPQCDIAYGFDPADISIYLDPLFQEKGWSLAFVLSRNFWTFSLKFLQVGISFLRFTFRRAVVGGFVKWNAVFVPLAGTLFLLPSGPLRVVAIVALAANTLTPTVRETALFFIDVLERGAELPLVGVAAEYLLTWLRFPNYQAFPPFGEPAANDWICFVLNISSVFYILAILLLTAIIVSGLLLSGFVGFAIAVLVDVVLLPLNLLWFIFRAFISTALMYNTGMMAQGALRSGAPAEPPPPIYRYTAKPADAAPARLFVGSPLARAGVLSTAGAIDAGGVAFVRASSVPRGRGEPWWRALLLAGAGIWMGLWRWGTLGWRDAWRHGPLRVRGGRTGRASDCVVFTSDVPAEHRAGFPMDLYMNTHWGRTVHEIPGVVAVDSRMINTAWSDEALSVYHAREDARPRKTLKIN
jgi:hypothetical protein